MTYIMYIKHKYVAISVMPFVLFQLLFPQSACLALMFPTIMMFEMSQIIFRLFNLNLLSALLYRSIINYLD
jgi:hypothetical protein